MNITVNTINSNSTHLTGGEFAIPSLEIDIDETLPYVTQRGLVIHAIIEVYNRGLPHDKVEQLTEFINEGLEQLDLLVADSLAE